MGRSALQMGRTKYSEEERNKIITNFLRCTREIIEIEGIENVSIRRVSQRAGFNSATLYLYFRDVDELITLASMGYLENYCRTLAADSPLLKTPYDVYFHTWKIFSQHAFAHPKVFHHLFFYPHSLPLNESVSRYYTIYPGLLGEFDGPIREMLQQGLLEERNLKILEPLARANGLTEQETAMINELTVCYFKKLLEDHGDQEGSIAADRQVNRMMQAIEFLFQRVPR